MAEASGSDRLDRIEETLDRLTESHQNLHATVTGLVESNRQLQTTVANLVQIVEIHQSNHETSQRNFEIVVRRLETIETELRGLRTESLRILAHLFGEQQEE